MTHIQTFSIQRILLLMQKELYENLKIVSVGYISFFGIATAVVALNFIGGGEAWAEFSDFFEFGLFITGLFISGMAFKSFRSKEGTMSYLSIPASVLEKFLSMLLLTTLGLVIFYIAAFSIFDFLFVALGNSLTNQSTEYFRFFSADLPHLFLVYLIVQSIFLAGAATFKKVPLFFTVFWSFVFLLGVGLYSTGLVYLFRDTFESTAHQLDRGVNINLMDLKDSGLWISKIPEFTFYYLTAPVFWAVTYFKIKEKEA
jgi:hypothetical protein